MNYGSYLILHWLRINESIQYKLASIAFNAISAFCFSSPIVWNGLSEHVRTSATREIFSGRLKTKLFCTL